MPSPFLAHEHVDVGAGQLPHLAGVDRAGEGDDARRGGLSVHLGQAGRGQQLAPQQVAQDVPRPDGGQLVRVTHEQ